MHKTVLKNKIYIFLIILCVFVSGCSDVNLQTNSVSYMMILDFEDATDIPQTRLCVFSKININPREVKSVKLVSNASSLEWILDNPEIFETSASNWCGGSNFSPTKNTNIENGRYSFFVYDKTEHESSFEFNLSYDVSLLEKHPSDFPDAMGAQQKEFIALYAEDGVLLYYGNRKKSWKEESNIWNEYKNASSMRICWLNHAETLVCMMPTVQKNIEDKN